MTHKLFNLHPCSLLIVTAREIKTLAASPTQLAWFWSSGDAAACAVRSAPTAPSARGGATTSRPVRHAPRERPSRRRACGACRARPRRAAGSRSAPRGQGRGNRALFLMLRPPARGAMMAIGRRGCDARRSLMEQAARRPRISPPVPACSHSHDSCSNRHAAGRTHERAEAQLQVTFAHLARFLSILFSCAANDEWTTRTFYDGTAKLKL